MSNTINNGSLTSNGANAVIAPPTASIVLPANCLCFLDVLNRHSTAGSLSAAPTISSTGGETWHLLTSLTTGAASPNVRVSRYYTMVSTATTTIVTMTFSVAQTNILWDVNWVSGCKTSGVDGADAIGQVVTSAPVTAGTSCAISIAAFANPRNALFAVYAAANSTGLTPQTGWTESADHTAASCELQEQFTLSYDTQANVGTGGLSLLLAGIATEIVAASSTINVQTIVNTTVVLSAGTGVSVPFSVVAGRQYFFNFVMTVNSGVENVGLTVKGGVLTFTVDASITVINAFAGRHRFGRFAIPAFTGPVTLKLDNPASAGNSTGQLAIVEVANFDLTVGGGTGIYQTVSSGASGAVTGPISISIGALTSRDNPILLLGSDAGNFPIAGYQIESAAITSGAVGPYTQWRGNGDPLPHFGGGAGNSVAAVVYEMAAAAGFNSPILSLVSPTAGSSIASSATVTIDATDLDGDLSTVVITANGVTVFSGSYQTGYSGTARSITHGTEFAFSATSGWAGGALGIAVTATDAQGHTASATYAFTVITNAPVVTLVTPSNGSTIANTASITIDVTDPDGDLSTVTITENGVNVYSSGAFQTGFTSSTKTTITNGFRFVLVPSTTWSAGALGIAVTAVDALSHTTPASFGFTVSPTVTHDPVITLVTPASPGTIGEFVSVKIDITDADDDLSSFTITANGETVYTAGSFVSPYLSSTKTVITHGFEVLITRTGGWPDTSLGITVAAVDALSHTATGTFTWSPVTPAPPVPPTPPTPSPPSFAPLIPLGDVLVEWAAGETDMAIEDDDIGTDRGLHTAMILSIFTDRRAEKDDALPDATGDVRGWWGDQFATVPGDKIGSRLWLLDRSARRENTVQRATEYLRECLAWMLEDRVASTITVEVVTTPPAGFPPGLYFAVGIVRPTGQAVSFRFAHVWASP